jgi:hypothetical protein
MGRTVPWLSTLALIGTSLHAAPGGTARDSGASSALTAARGLAAYGDITSTYRSIAHNRAVGGVPNSFHLQGRAIDVARRPGVSHRQLDAALRKAGYNLIESLDEGDHSHFAFGPLNPRVGAVSAVAQASPPNPPKTDPPRLLADEHGTLRLDLAAQGPATGPATP